ncbi:unnamed protein product, partial [Symbiodinium microadriaticum]
AEERRLRRCQSDSELLKGSSSKSYISPTDYVDSPAAETDTELPEGIPSVGSVWHASRQCRPCAWFWKPIGCANGSSCRHCHLCPE